MKYNKKLIGLIAGLVCLILCVILLLATCGAGNEAAPTEPSEQATQTPSEGTEAPAEEATEPNEETTEPTEEETESSSSSGGSSSPGGTGGFTGGGSGSGSLDSDTGSSDDSGSESTTEELVVADPGTQGNPYAEIFGEELGSFTTVNLPTGQTIYYNLYSVSGSVLTIEAPDAYVIYNGTTYKAQNGIVKLNLAADESGAPASVQIGTYAAQPTAYDVCFEWPYGSEDRPYEVTVDQIPAVVTTDQIGAGEGLYYNIYGINGTIIRIQDADAQVTCNGVTYQAENGVVTVPIAEGSSSTPAALYISNAGTAAKQITMNIDYEQGTANRPYDLQMGEFVTDIASAGKSVYYRYTAEAAGVVTLQYVSGADQAGYDYLLYNAGTGDCRTLAADAVTDAATGITTVSVQMNQGDVLSVVISADAAAQMTSKASFAAGAELTDDAVRATYTVSVRDNAAAPVADVRLSVKVGTTNLELTTNAEGVASITLSADTCGFTLTQPDGYTASETAFELTADAPERTIVMTPNETAAPDGSKVEYTVTVVDYNGNAQSNVVVQFLKDGTVVALQTTDAAGNAKTALEQGSYTVALAFSSAGNYYDESLGVLTAETTSVRIPIAKGVSGEIEELYVGNAYRIYVGGTYVENMQSNVTNYFIFTPTQAGVYRFTTSNPAAVISYWGASVHVINDITGSTDYADNVFTLNTKQNNLGSEYILGVTGASECVIEITRISDPILDETDIPAEVYKAKTTPKSFTLNLSAGQNLTYVDVTGKTGDYNLVLGSDGYYHLGSASGPVMYVNLGPNAPYVSFYQMLGYGGYGGTSFMKTFRDENGNLVTKEDYTACMCQYVECVDQEGYGVYPMTEDLYYMLQNGGEYRGWWDSTNPNYLFTEVEGVNTEIAWMFCCCYIQ